jgi:hypothetical protein
MTVDYKADVMYDIRKHLWENLQSSEIIDPYDYYSDNLDEVLVPIIPVQQMAEMNQFLSGKTHIVYDKVGISYEDNWAICCEQIMFNIYSTDFAQIVEIRNLMMDLYRRMDESARDVNWFDQISDKFKFYSIFIADISATTPSEELAGFLSTEVVLEVKYSREANTEGRFI